MDVAIVTMKMILIAMITMIVMIYDDFESLPGYTNNSQGYKRV